MQDFKNLTVWKRSHELTLAVYKVTKRYPKEELFGLTSQIRRSSSAIPTNIAEGSGRGSNADFRRFLLIANGSAKEVEYQLILSRELEYLAPRQYDDLLSTLDEVQRMLTTLIQRVEQQQE